MYVGKHCRKRSVSVTVSSLWQQLTGSVTGHGAKNMTGLLSLSLQSEARYRGRAVGEMRILAYISTNRLKRKYV